METDYSYQIKAAKDIYEKAISSKFEAVILAATPSSGKSTILINIINLFIEKDPSLKIIVLTHNQNLLKTQMFDDFNTGFVTPLFTFGYFNEGKQVEIGIPSSRDKIDKCDILIIDEAHHYFNSSMILSIKERLSPKYVIGMTGTPSYFNSFNSFNVQKKFGVYYISAEELVDLGVFSTVLVDVVNGEDLESRLNNSMKKAVSHGMDLSKIIVAAKDQMEANMIGYLLSKQGRKVAVSTSSVDPKNERLGGYKQGRYDTLVIVLKGVLGFSDVNTTGMIDLRTSSDIDCRSQIFARVLRKHPKDIKKFYISAVVKKNHNKEVKMLQSVIGLMQRKNFISYTK